MTDIDRETIEHLRTWLSNRSQANESTDHYHSNAVIQPSDKLRALAFPDLHLNRFTRFACSPLKRAPQHSPSRDTYLRQTLRSLSQFLTKLRANRQLLEAIELLRSSEADKSTATFNLSESIDLVQTCLTFTWALDIQINQLECILIEDSTPSIQSLISRICALLFSSSPARLVARSSHYSTCLLGAFLVDLFHEAGFSRQQLQLLVFATGASELGSSWLLSPLKAQQTQRKSLVAICFSDTDTVLALRSIFCSLVRELPQHRKLILLMEEANYDTFLYHWENSSHAFMPALQDKDFKIDLNCIDIRLAHRMSRACINVIKFRSLGDLQNLMGKLGKVSYIQLWSNNHMLARDVALNRIQTNQCEEFWLNQTQPGNIAGHRFSWQLVKYFRSSMKLHMDGIYSNVFYEFEERLDSLRKRATKFANSNDRLQLTVKSYISLISKFKSMKQMSATVGESVSRLRKFHLSSATTLLNIEGNSQIETILSPIGIAILIIKSEHCIKSKSTLVEFIFKNLMLGNGVMLICPAAILGSRVFNGLLKIDRIPFDWINPMGDDLVVELSPDDTSSASATTHSDSSWDSTDSGLNNSILRRQLKCPKNTYAVEFNQRELTTDKVDLLVLTLGTKRRSIWFSNANPVSTDEGQDTRQFF